MEFSSTRSATMSQMFGISSKVASLQTLFNFSDCQKNTSISIVLNSAFTIYSKVFERLEKPHLANCGKFDIKVKM